MADRERADGSLVPVIVRAEDQRGWREGGTGPKIVTLFAPIDDIDAFLSEALGFTQAVLRTVPPGQVPPTPCVYVPSFFEGRDQALVIGRLVAAGAVALNDDDLNVSESPASSVAFAQAVEQLHREVRPEQSRPFDDGISAFAPDIHPLPRPDDARWTRVMEAAYARVARRSSDDDASGDAGGWLVAD